MNISRPKDAPVSQPREEWAVALALVLGVALALALLAGLLHAPAAPAKQSESEACGDVVVQFKPEGSGGAHSIRATRIECDPARNIARSCIEGTVAEGWTVVLWDDKIRMAKGDKRIRYLPVGGGGCGHLPETCDDFSYRGVGFFGMELVGIPCGGEKGGRAIAKSWYDSGGNCSFGNTCDVGPFTCKANPKTATIACTRPNGYRVRWQMGE